MAQGLADFFESLSLSFIYFGYSMAEGVSGPGIRIELH